MTNWESVLTEAHKAASDAGAAELARQPENPNAFDCGFAWVTIPGNHPLARHARNMRNSTYGQSPQFAGEYARKYGDKGYPRGWQWWCPGEFRGQSVRVWRVGAVAFAAVLAKHGVRADVGSRLD
jgi:hypothetical protein